VAFGHSLLGYASASRGLDRLEADRARLAEDLAANWEVLAEAVQTVMRRYGVEDAYEQLKALTRGERVTPERLRDFIRAAAIPEEAKARLLALTPATYTGAAAELAKKV
jgi:adenylosuccinate lyase